MTQRLICVYMICPVTVQRMPGIDIAWSLQQHKHIRGVATSSLFILTVVLIVVGEKC